MENTQPKTHQELLAALKKQVFLLVLATIVCRLSIISLEKICRTTPISFP